MTAVFWAAGTAGFSGLLTQMLLLRELLVVFGGNELTIGLILACWLITEASGALWARRWTDSHAAGDLRNQYMRMALLICIVIIPALLAARLIKPALGISVGTVPGPGLAVAASLVILMPVGFSHGALFPLGCALYRRAAAHAGTFPGRAPAGRVYILETAGTLLAGLLWTAALIRIPNVFVVAAGLALLQAGTAAAIIRRAAPPAIAMVLAVGFLAFGGAGYLQHRSIGALWYQQNVLLYENSMHGNIVVTENQGQYTFFTDGTPAFLTPVVDESLVDPLIHIPLTTHRNPRSVLLIGGGAAGFLDAILLHPSVERVDYTENDPRLLQLQYEAADRTGERWMDDPRVHLHPVDGRGWLQANDHQFDVIISRYHDPANLHSSRYFSGEFLQLAARRLTRNGILVLGFPGLVGHLNEPLRHLGSGVHHAMQQEFPYVRAFPGSSESFLLASHNRAIIEVDADRFADHLRHQNLMETVSLPWHVEQRLHPRWHQWFLEFTAPGSRRVSGDFFPRVLYLSVAHWSTKNAPVVARVLQALYPLQPVVLAGAVILVVLLPAWIFGRGGGRQSSPVMSAAVTTGFTAMVIHLSLIFSFQILAGRLFGWIGLLAAVFMAGLGVGALSMDRVINRRSTFIQNPFSLVKRTEVLVLAFCGGLLVLLPSVAPLLSRTPVAVVRGLFLVLLALGGAVCGAQFPALCAVLPSRESGRVYAADLLGGCLGGVLGGIIMIPLLGMVGTGATIVLLKGVSLFLLLSRTSGITLKGES